MRDPVIKLDGKNALVSVYDDKVVINHKKDLGPLGKGDDFVITYDDLEYVYHDNGKGTDNAEIRFFRRSYPIPENEPATHYLMDKGVVHFGKSQNDLAARIVRYTESRIYLLNKKNGEPVEGDYVCPACNKKEMNTQWSFNDYELRCCGSCGALVKVYDDKEVTILPDNKVISGKAN